MFTTNEIKNYLEKYVIRDGNVYLKENNQQVIDEDVILRVKSARLIYNVARENYENDAIQFRKPNGDMEKYIRTTMERLGVNGEENIYGENKLINALLASNGHYEEYLSGADLIGSKFSMLVGVKKDYGLAYLKLKFREKGLDIENLNIKQDSTRLKRDGLTKVIIDFQIKKYEKKSSIENQQTNTQTNSNIMQEDNQAFKHPKADILNDLEKQKKDAQAHNDEVAYNYAQSNIERIIRENPVEVSPKKWDSMGYDERKSFYLIKMKEAKVLDDKDSFNFWNSNLKLLESANTVQKQESVSTSPKTEPEKVVQPENSSSVDKENLSTNINNLKNQMQELSVAYQEMLSDGVIDEQELDLLIVGLQNLNDSANALKVNSLSSTEEQIVNGIIASISDKKQKVMMLKDGTEQNVHR